MPLTAAAWFVSKLYAPSGIGPSGNMWPASTSKILAARTPSSTGMCAMEALLFCSFAGAIMWFDVAAAKLCYLETPKSIAEVTPLLLSPVNPNMVNSTSKTTIFAQKSSHGAIDDPFKKVPGRPNRRNRD